jgi:hypothetical protein
MSENKNIQEHWQIKCLNHDSSDFHDIHDSETKNQANPLIRKNQGSDK